MIAKSLSLLTQPSGVGIEAAPTEGKHFVSKAYLESVLASLSAASHAAVTKADTNSIAITLTGQAISAAVRRKTSPGTNEGLISEDASGIFVVLGTGANQAARGSDYAALVTTVSGKAATVHTHAIADVTGLQAALDAAGGGDESIAIDDVSGLTAALGGKAASTHSHSFSDVPGLQAALDAAGSGSGGSGSVYWKNAVGTFASLPLNTATIGEARLVRDEGVIYRCVATVGFGPDQWKSLDFLRSSFANLNGGPVLLAPNEFGAPKIPEAYIPTTPNVIDGGDLDDV